MKTRLGKAAFRTGVSYALCKSWFGMTSFSHLEFPPSREFGSENLRLYSDVCDLLEPIVCRGLDRTKDISFAEDRAGTAVDIDVEILNRQAVTPPLVFSWLSPIQTVLRRQSQYWRVRIWLEAPEPTILDPYLIWMEIDANMVMPYRGMKPHEHFDSMDELYSHYWPETK
jgi:hypothetical protein